jgi:hypothetical protein
VVNLFLTFVSPVDVEDLHLLVAFLAFVGDDEARGVVLRIKVELGGYRELLYFFFLSLFDITFGILIFKIFVAGRGLFL